MSPDYHEIWDASPVGQAYAAVRKAEAALTLALQNAYPLNSTVEVNSHNNVCFRGEVVGHDFFGARLLVRNFKSGKTNKWWSARATLID